MGHAGDFAAFWTQYVAAATSVAAAAVDPFEVAGFFPLMAASGATVASMVVTVGVATATVAASYFVPLIAAAAGTTIVSIVQSAAPAAASFDSSEAAAAGMAGPSLATVVGGVASGSTTCSVASAPADSEPRPRPPPRHAHLPSALGPPPRAHLPRPAQQSQDRVPYASRNS